MVQTGPNTQFGGEKGGFTSVLYQVGMEVIVNGVLINPISSHPTIEVISLERFFIIIPASQQ